MQTKSCNKCHVNKPLQDFYKHATCKDGHLNICRQCTMTRTNAYRRANPQRNKKYHAEWRSKNPTRAKEINRNSRIRCTYGLTHLDYLTLLLKQNHGCAICGTAKRGRHKRFHIDHCHATGKVRGLLCHHCNLMLGNAKDNIETLATAITYLSRHK